MGLSIRLATAWLAGASALAGVASAASPDRLEPVGRSAPRAVSQLQSSAPSGRQAPSAENLVNFDVVALPADERGHIELAAVFRIERGWHLYWRNPGDSGMAPTITVKLPDGFAAGWSVGEIRWPAPRRFGGDEESTYGYEGDVALFVTLSPPKDATAGSDAARPPRQVEVAATWMVCKSICLTGGRTRTVAIAAAPVQETNGQDTHGQDTHSQDTHGQDTRAQDANAQALASVIARSRAALPEALSAKAISLTVAPDGRSGVVRVRVAPAGPSTPSAPPRLEFFPFDTPGVAYGSPTVAAGESAMEIAVPLEINPGNALGQPLRAAGLLRVPPSGGRPERSFEFATALQPASDTAEPPKAAPAPPAPTGPKGPSGTGGHQSPPR